MANFAGKCPAFTVVGEKLKLNPSRWLQLVVQNSNAVLVTQKKTEYILQSYVNKMIVKDDTVTVPSLPAMFIQEDGNSKSKLEFKFKKCCFQLNSELRLNGKRTTCDLQLSFTNGNIIVTPVQLTGVDNLSQPSTRSEAMNKKSTNSTLKTKKKNTDLNVEEFKFLYTLGTILLNKPDYTEILATLMKETSFTYYPPNLEPFLRKSPAFFLLGDQVKLNKASWLQIVIQRSNAKAVTLKKKSISLERLDPKVLVDNHRVTVSALPAMYVLEGGKSKLEFKFTEFSFQLESLTKLNGQRTTCDLQLDLIDGKIIATADEIPTADGKFPSSQPFKKSEATFILGSLLLQRKDHTETIDNLKKALIADHLDAEDVMALLAETDPQVFTMSEDLVKLNISCWFLTLLINSNASSVKKQNYVNAQPSMVSVKNGIVYVNGLLAKTRYTKPQVWLYDANFNIPFSKQIEPGQVLLCNLEVKMEDGRVNFSPTSYEAVDPGVFDAHVTDDYFWEYNTPRESKNLLRKVATITIQVYKTRVVPNIQPFLYLVSGRISGFICRISGWPDMKYDPKCYKVLLKTKNFYIFFF